jgi:serine/threonine protein kinase
LQEASAMIGKLISHYRILEELGRGGMGVVYKAFDTRLRRPVAIKILPPHLVADEKNLRRFTQEAQAASALNHPNICTIHEIDEHDGIHFIVMEFIDGETLRQILERRGSFPEPEVIAIGMKVADALKAAHAKGIIHRDLKPENIMISREGYVKVMDFGLAKLKDSATESSWEMASTSSTSANPQSYRTSVSSFLGTSAYMSPEQIEKKPVDERSDIFSLGVVLYELLTASSPFVGKDNWEVMQAILQDIPQSPSHFVSVKTNALDAPVLKALAKEPTERHANCIAFFQALEKIQMRRNRKKTRRNAMVMVSFLLLISIIILVIVTSGVFKTPPASSPPSLKIYPIGITSGSEEWPSFAPDGCHLIYSSKNVGTSNLFDIWIKDISLFQVKSLQKKQRFLAHGNELSWK